MKGGLVRALLALALAAAVSAAPGGAEPRAQAIVVVTAFGACSGCSSDVNRVAFQAAITAAAPGDTLYIPDGTYTVNKAPGSFWCLLLPKSLTVRGQSREGAVVAMDPATAVDPATIWLWNVTAPSDVLFVDLQLDGNKPGKGAVTPYQKTLEHHPGFFVQGTDRITFRNLEIHDFTGDGIQLYNGTTDVLVEDSRVRWCQRAGVSLTGLNVERVLIRRNQLILNTTQQVDNESGPAYDVEVTDNDLAPGRGDYTVAISGSDSDAPSRRWNVHHNRLEGATFVVWAQEVVLADNVGTNAVGSACIEISRSAEVTIERVRCRMTQTAEDGLSAVFASGTMGSGPRVTVRDSFFQVDHGPAWGVRLDGVVSALVDNNELIGPGIVSAGYAGVRARATVVGRDVEMIEVTRNRIRDWGMYGISFVGTTGTQAKIAAARVAGNRIGNTRAGGPIRFAISLDDGTGVLRAAAVSSNVRGCGVTTQITGVPAGLTIAASPLAVSEGCP